MSHDSAKEAILRNKIKYNYRKIVQEKKLRWVVIKELESYLKLLESAAAEDEKSDMWRTPRAYRSN